jgi:hypothetical protein
MSIFHHLYDPEATIWNIYLKFVFADLDGERSPSLQRAIEWFREYPGYRGYPGMETDEVTTLKNVTSRSVKEINIDQGIQFLESTIIEAVHYASNERLEPGQARSLAEAFMTEFESPLVFCNWVPSSSPNWGLSYGNVTDPELGYTLEYFLCCIDRNRIGFVFSLNNE